MPALLLVFPAPPSVVSVSAIASTDAFKVDLQYGGRQWSIQTTRQALLQLHAHLKLSITLHNLLDVTANTLTASAMTAAPASLARAFTADRLSTPRSPRPEERPSSARESAPGKDAPSTPSAAAPPPITRHDPAEEAVALQSRRRSLQKLQTNSEQELTAVASLRSPGAASASAAAIEFPAKMLPGRAAPPADSGAGLIAEYLTRLFHQDTGRNHHAVLEFLRVSTLSFDPRLAQSVWEGWVKMERRPPLEGDLQWHTLRAGRLVLGCACFPAASFSRQKKFWMVHKPAFVAFLRKPTDEFPRHVLLMDAGLQVRKGFSATGGHRHALVASHAWTADIRFPHRMEKKAWFDRAERFMNAKLEHPYASFARERSDGKGRFLVDGQAYFLAVADALEAARNEIMISGWWVCPDVELKRGGSTVLAAADDRDEWTLRAVLMRAAERGVMVRVFMYQEVSLVMSLASKFQECRLGSHPNIHVVRHPVHELRKGVPSLLWSHHEKLVVVDQRRAFVGGLDLAWGRFDNSSHALFGEYWKGADLCNPRIKDEDDPRSFGRSSLGPGVPRMPWHDVSFELVGLAAQDCSQHFCHQWNNALFTVGPVAPPCTLREVFDDVVEEEEGLERVAIQIVRSCGPWSGVVHGEASIQTAYVEHIARARRFIYIENQFFQSGMQGDDQVQNRIVDALYQRIARAAAEKQSFRVILVVPLLPAFQGNIDASHALRSIMFWQYRTLCRGENSLMERLRRHPDVGDRVEEFLLVLGLRTFDACQDAVKTEMVYVHSKLMIIDDHVSLVGSANINDRSMLGSRDTEVCAVVKDLDFDAGHVLNGEDWALSGRVVRGLRMALMQEHFGPIAAAKYEDFCYLNNFRALHKLARENTRIFDRLFACAPADHMTAFKDLKQQTQVLDMGGGEEPASASAAALGRRPMPKMLSVASLLPAPDLASGASGEEADPPSSAMGDKIRKLLERVDPSSQHAMSLRLLDNVQGNAVLFPFRFLQDERSLLLVNFVVGEHIYM